MNEKLPLSIKLIPVTQAVGGEAYTFLHWEESRRWISWDVITQMTQEEMKAALAEGKLTGEQFDKAVATTSRAFYETLFEELSQSREAYVQLDRVLYEKFGRNAPNLQGLKR